MLKIFFLSLLLQFSPYAFGSSFDEAQLQSLLAKNPTTLQPVRSIEELVPLLPEELRSNFTFIYDSRSPFKKSITPEFPRTVLFTEDGKLILTFTGNPALPGFNILESIKFDDKTSTFTLNAYDLTGAGREAETKTTCTGCHGDDPRPINDSYPIWPGFYGSIKDTFPPNEEIGRTEKKNFLNFMQTNAKAGVYKYLKFPEGSINTPYLDEKNFDAAKLQGDLNLFKYMPNTRFGMAITQLNRKRIFRKLMTSPIFQSRYKEFLRELLDCGDSQLPPDAAKKIEELIKRENSKRLVRAGVPETSPEAKFSFMQELQFTREIAQMDWIATESKVSREDWSMAIEKNSLSFFDGVLSGISENKSYYIKEDLIFEMMRHLAENDSRFGPYYQPRNVYESYGYSFGKKIRIKKARASCDLLKSTDVRK
ncbi:MAG: hypothetical protein V4736_02105 [Bdellovibrionota bacterium]